MSMRARKREAILPSGSQAPETVSKLEIRAGDDLGGVGAAREPPEIRALLEASLR